MYRILNQNEDTCEILLYSLIERGWTANRIIGQLRAHPNIKNITLRINSDGGEIFEALTLYNFLKSREANITVCIDGIAASAASVVACAGRVVMPAHAMMMIHNPCGYGKGDSDDVRALAEVLDKVKESIIAIYQAKTGKDHDTIAELMTKETWLTAQEAYDCGLCDEIIDAPKEPEPDPAADSRACLTDNQAAAELMISDAIRTERRRLQELDALMTLPDGRQAGERKGLIMKAKYETFQSASDIALELLKLQSRKEDYQETAAISADYEHEKEDDGIRHIADIINRRRGY